MPRDGERPKKHKHKSNGERRHRDRDRQRENGTAHHQESSETPESEIEVTASNPYLETSTAQPTLASSDYRPSDASSATFSTNNEELATLQRLCDNASAPESWDAVRDWLRTHSAADARAAAERRGDYDTAPLHLACRNDPPADVIEMLLMASQEMVRAADSFGWLPLHYACANDASEEVLTLLVAEFPESTTSVDKRKRTPLHFALGRTERPADRRVVVLLSGTGAALYPDENGMLPLHYACAYGATEEALRVLTDDNVVTITATDHRGRTPLHFALGNADRPASPAVVGLLLSQNPTVVDSIDKEGNLPIHLLSTRSHAIGEYATEQRTNCQKCLGLYLQANPKPTAELLMSLQSLPDWLRDLAVVNPVVQRFLNVKIATPLPTAITIGDFIFYILVIVFYQRAVIWSINDRVKGTDNITQFTGYLAGLYIAAIYFALREFVQAVSLATIGLFSTWVWDGTNWFDIFYIILILFWTIVMQRESLELQTFRVGASLTFAVYWLNVLVFLKGIMVGFAVFVGGVVYVMKRLAAFFLALLIILLAFAQIFWTIFRMTAYDYGSGGCTSNTSAMAYIVEPDPPQEVCDYQNENECVTPEPELCEPENNEPWCSPWSSIYKTYSMLLGEVDDNDFEGNKMATFFFCMYMFVVVIVLANVLIAIVTDAYGVIKNERAAVVFWSNRLDFVAEMDVIGSNVSSLWKRLTGSDDDDEEIEGVSMSSILGEIWKKFMYLYDDTDYQYDGVSMEFILYTLLRFGIACIVIPLWIIVGFATFGIVWPPQVREYLLTSSVTLQSEKGEEEIARLERAEALRQNVTMFHEEVRKDIDQGKRDMTNLRIFVSDARSEIATEMKEVKRIVMELYENNLD